MTMTLTHLGFIVDICGLHTTDFLDGWSGGMRIRATTTKEREGNNQEEVQCGGT
jgi:hypothetical protein